MTFHEAATHITDALRAQGDFVDEHNKAVIEDSTWYSKLISRVALLAADAEIKYVSGAVSQTSDAPNARVVVFTEHRVIEAIVLLHGDPEADFEPEVVTFARNFITAVEAYGTTNVFDGGRGSLAFPGPFQLRITYAGDRSIVVPVGLNSSSRARPLTEFLPNLLADLNSDRGDE